MTVFLVDAGAVPATAAVAVPVQNPEPPPGKGPEFGKASPIALVVIVVLALVTVLLIRSMTKRIRRLPDRFGGPEEKSDSDSAQSDAEEPRS